MDSLYKLRDAVLITGVSPNGLGAAMAMALASEHPVRLIFTARQIAKADEVAHAIRTKVKDPPSMMSIEMDLSSFESVRAAAERLVEQNITINTLVNNAGVMALPNRTLSVDGHEMYFATNFLGHWLFTNLISRWTNR
jgi:NAD(P)-dependent dehydrogenase (short-subunit alcohol dehydrogenase family)